MNDTFIYELKDSLMTKSELSYYNAIVKALPDGYHLQPQVNLASVINRTDNSKFHNELFRNIDFLILTSSFKPVAFIEINDPTHNDSSRIKRDIKVKEICEEAGISIITFWTKYGVNQDYIDKKINEAISNGYPKRITHSHNDDEDYTPRKSSKSQMSKEGCYIATCVYGSYDCPEVLTLRRYRDNILRKNLFGRLLVRVYYLISPTLVRLFGNMRIFKRFFKKVLDKKIFKLNKKGISSLKYNDK